MKYSKKCLFWERKIYLTENTIFSTVLPPPFPTTTLPSLLVPTTDSLPPPPPKTTVPPLPSLPSTKISSSVSATGKHWKTISYVLLHRSMINLRRHELFLLSKNKSLLPHYFQWFHHWKIWNNGQLNSLKFNFSSGQIFTILCYIQSSITT